jgi:hypothetical protein
MRICKEQKMKKILFAMALFAHTTLSMAESGNIEAQSADIENINSKIAHVDELHAAIVAVDPNSSSCKRNALGVSGGKLYLCVSVSNQTNNKWEMIGSTSAPSSQTFRHPASGSQGEKQNKVVTLGSWNSCQVNKQEVTRSSGTASVYCSVSVSGGLWTGALKTGANDAGYCEFWCTK